MKKPWVVMGKTLFLCLMIGSCAKEEVQYGWDDLSQPGKTPLSADESAILQLEFPPFHNDSNNNLERIFVDSSLSNLDRWMGHFVMTEEWAAAWNSDSLSMNQFIQEFIKLNNSSISWKPYNFGLETKYYLMPRDYLTVSWKDDTEQKHAMSAFYPNTALEISRIAFNKDSTQAFLAYYYYPNMSNWATDLNFLLYEKVKGKWVESKLWIFWDFEQSPTTIE